MGKTIGSNFNLTPRHGDAPPCIYNVYTVAFTTLAFFIINTLSVNPANAVSIANYVGANVSDGDWVKISSSGNVGIDVLARNGGSLGVGKHTITVETNSANGYQLYVSGSNTDTNGYTSLYYNGDTASGSSRILGLNAANPTAFASNNAWGYAVPDGVATPAYTAYDAVINTGGSTDTSTINSLKWLGLTRNYQAIASSDAPNEGHPTGTDVYYGVYIADDTIQKGSYYNSVIYTAFVEGGDSVVVTPAIIGKGSKIHITTNHEGNATPITANHIAVKLYDKDDLSKNIGTCDNIQVPSNGTSDNPLIFTCEANFGSDAVFNDTYSVEIQIDAEANGIYLSHVAEDTVTYHQNWRDGITTMQDLDTMACLASPEDETAHLTDTRTGTSYLVTRMRDGNCWMTQNLYFPAETTTIATQNDNSYTLPTSAASNFASNGHKGNGWYDGGTNGHIDNTVDANNNTGSRFGWMVATAGTGNLHGETTLASPTIANGNIASDSICPQGWKLPSGGSDSDFEELYTTTHNNNYLVFNAYWFGALIGICSNSNCIDSQGSSAFWWTATQYNNSNGYNIYMNSSSFNPTGTNNKLYGYSVRCMLNTTPYDYTITYNANGGTGAPATQSGSSAHVTISTTEPTRDGYNFLGWGTSADATVPTYLPSKTIPLSSANRNSTLYAVWKEEPTFQNFTSTDCQAINFNDTIILKDSRDQKSYLVSRLKMSAYDTNGKCWMVQNLALDQGQVITPSDSNVSSDYIIPSTNSFPGGNHVQSAIMPSHKNAQIDAVDNTGGFYSFAAATAGSSPSSGTASVSICPKGWNLPTKDDFNNMYSGFRNTFNDAFKNAWRGGLVGYYVNDSISFSSSRAYWWSSTVFNDNGAYHAYQNETSFSTGNDGYARGNGRSVRCIFGP